MGAGGTAGQARRPALARAVPVTRVLAPTTNRLGPDGRCKGGRRPFAVGAATRSTAAPCPPVTAGDAASTGDTANDSPATHRTVAEPIARIPARGISLPSPATRTSLISLPAERRTTDPLFTTLSPPAADLRLTREPGGRLFTPRRAPWPSAAGSPNGGACDCPWPPAACRSASPRPEHAPAPPWSARSGAGTPSGPPTR